MDRNKILIVYGSLNSVPSPEGAAPAKVIVDTMKHLDKDKFRVLSHFNQKLDAVAYDRTVFQHIKPDFKDKMFLLLLKLRYQYKQRKKHFTTAQNSQLLYFISASRFIKRNGYHKVVVHVSTGMVQMIKLFNPNCEIVFYHHGTSLHTKQTAPQWESLLKKTVAIFGVNQAAADFANAHFKTQLPKHHYFKIGNGVDKAEFTASSEPSSGVFQILFSGRICKEKGVLELIKAYKMLKDKDYTISLVIAGDVGTIRGLKAGKEYLKLCKDYIDEYKLTVKFTGFVTQRELFSIYDQTNIVILPTNPKISLEGMSLSLLEAMSMGKPLIATNVGGNPEVIANGSNGFLIYGEENYAQELADRIEDIYLDYHLEKRMSENAINRYNTDFTTLKMSDNFLQALKRIGYVEK